MAGYDTLINVQTAWNLDDLLDAHEVLDIQQEVEAQAMEDAKRGR